MQSSVLCFIVFGEAIDGSGTAYDGNVGATPIKLGIYYDITTGINVE